MGIIACASLAASAGEWSGYIAGEWLAFPKEALSPAQHDSYLSIALEPEYNHAWDEGEQSLTFVPFLRVDEHDPERTHADLRELYWLNVGEDFEVRAGVRRVFWGVTEGVHLVDIINQTDLVENTDGEDKLGQPMLNLAFIRDWGTLDLFALLGFRERTFPGREGRPRFAAVVDTDRASYESDREWRHIDAALRWSHTLGPVDIALSHFSGTSREPRLVLDRLTGVIPMLLPHYDLIDQTGLELQAVQGGWLWKAEVMTRSGQGERFTAASGGFEYTYTGVLDSQADVGVIGEYLFDDRGEEIEALVNGQTSFSPFQNDVLVGTRLTLNDAQSTQVLAGVITDLEGGPRSYNIEASRRLGEDMKLSMEVRGSFDTETTDVLDNFRRDNSIRLELAWYF